MSRLSKFLFHPGEFWRDFLIKRYPERIGAYGSAEQAARSCRRARAFDGAFVWHQELDPFPVRFPIDIVFTWVDGDDPAWQERKHRTLIAAGREVAHHPESIVESRYRSRDELRYALRSILEYAPWFNRLFLVTDRQVPAWLEIAHPRLTVVDHAEIIPAALLPTFNSHVIEAHLHLIAGLSEHYVYFNDDVMLARPVPPEHFFASSGNVHVFVTDSVIPEGPHSELDTPVDWAAKNVRAILAKRFGVDLRFKTAHAFHPQLRSVNAEIREELREHIEAFLPNRFRGAEDLPLLTYLFPNYVYLTGRADLRQTSLVYFNINSPAARRNYEVLLERRDTELAPFCMCLNDTQIPGQDNTATRVQVEREHAFLERYFPRPCSFERRGGG